MAAFFSASCRRANNALILGKQINDGAAQVVAEWNRTYEVSRAISLKLLSTRVLNHLSRWVPEANRQDIQAPDEARK